MPEQGKNGGEKNKDADRPGLSGTAYPTGLVALINETLENERRPAAPAQSVRASNTGYNQHQGSSYQPNPVTASQQNQAVFYQHQRSQARGYVSPYGAPPQQNQEHAYAQDPGTTYALTQGSSSAHGQEQEPTPVPAAAPAAPTPWANQRLARPEVDPGHCCTADGHRYRKLTSTLEHMAWRCLLCGDGPLFEVWKCWKCDAFRCEPCAQHETTLAPAARIL